MHAQGTEPKFRRRCINVRNDVTRTSQNLARGGRVHRCPGHRTHSINRLLEFWLVASLLCYAFNFSVRLKISN